MYSSLGYWGKSLLILGMTFVTQQYKTYTYVCTYIRILGEITAYPRHDLCDPIVCNILTSGYWGKSLLILKSSTKQPTIQCQTSQFRQPIICTYTYVHTYVSTLVQWNTLGPQKVSLIRKILYYRGEIIHTYVCTAQCGLGPEMALIQMFPQSRQRFQINMLIKHTYYTYVHAHKCIIKGKQIITYYLTYVVCYISK